MRHPANEETSQPCSLLLYRLGQRTLLLIGQQGAANILENAYDGEKPTSLSMAKPRM